MGDYFNKGEGGNPFARWGQQQSSSARQDRNGGWGGGGGFFNRPFSPFGGQGQSGNWGQLSQALAGGPQAGAGWRGMMSRPQGAAFNGPPPQTPPGQPQQPPPGLSHTMGTETPPVQQQPQPPPQAMNNPPMQQQPPTLSGTMGGQVGSANDPALLLKRQQAMNQQQPQQQPQAMNNPGTWY